MLSIDLLYLAQDAPRATRTGSGCIPVRGRYVAAVTRSIPLLFSLRRDAFADIGHHAVDCTPKCLVICTPQWLQAFRPCSAAGENSVGQDVHGPIKSFYVDSKLYDHGLCFHALPGLDLE